MANRLAGQTEIKIRLRVYMDYFAKTVLDRPRENKEREWKGSVEVAGVGTN